ncbi:unnamed protein product [Owenia fusiformis]|uniref:Uncharacterized protein n=1 Tax=Owenia fusiformis TaxID=6347 RepID=A0A8S4PFE7_OWEFU|nr:unnamed protein product [Owenia fusiformis]
MSSKRIRKVIDIAFSNLDEKEDFFQRWNKFRKRHPALKNSASAMSYLLSCEKQDFGNYEQTSEDSFNYNNFKTIDKERSKAEPLFVCCPQSIQSLIEAVYRLGQLYYFKRDGVTSQIEQFSNVVATFTISNNHCTFTWKSSPYVKGGTKFFVNEKIACGTICSGILDSHFQRFTRASKLGNTSTTFIIDVLKRISPAVSIQASLSMREAIDASEVRSADNKLTLETDACFSAFRNAQRSITFALCNNTHTIVANKVKSTKDPECPNVQQHETISTDEILQDLHDQGKQVRCIVHDSNNSVSKIIHENFPDVNDQNGVWHKIKSAMSGFLKLTKGTKETENITWHSQLIDKYEGVKNHFWYSIMNCGNDADILIDS